MRNVRVMQCDRTDSHTTRGAIRSVYGAEEAPCLRKQLTDISCFHGGEERSSMHTPEMGEIAEKVELG